MNKHTFTVTKMKDFFFSKEFTEHCDPISLLLASTNPNQSEEVMVLDSEIIDAQMGSKWKITFEKMEDSDLGENQNG